MSVMELIVPLVINIISNVINGNTKLLEIAPIKFTSVQAKYDTQLVYVKIDILKL